LENRELSIRLAQEDIGWVYPDFKWLTKKEAILANRKRNDLLQSLANKVSYTFMQNKLHLGKLSPGCLICGQGYWSCMFINALCTAHCFYCPQDRKIKKECPPDIGQGIKFDNPKDYIDYLEKFNFKGVSFSGGEPLLVFGKLLGYLKKMRQRFGKGFYLWIYTNGSLVNKDNLKRLKEVGLNEIRFNISAKNYDLRPIELAVNILDTVTVEIPAIPEDYEIVKKCLLKIQQIGVKYCNIHQLMTTEHNYKNYINRNYTFLHHPNIPIFESEIVALRLIKYAIDNKISLPINYCTAAYKNRLQGKGKREQWSSVLKEDFEEITNAGYIRGLSIQDSPTNIKRIINILKEKRCQNNLWALNDAKTEIFLHGSLLGYFNFAKCNLIINYFEPQLKTALDSNGNTKKVILDFKKKIFLRKELIAQQKGLSTVAMQSFQKLFIEKNMNEKETLNYFYKNYNLRTKEDFNLMKEEIEILIALKTWEHLEVGFPEIY